MIRAYITPVNKNQTPKKMPDFIDRYHSENGTVHVHPSAYKNFYKNRYSEQEIETHLRVYRPLDTSNMVKFYEKAVKNSNGYCVGFEIEKEDLAVKESVFLHDFKTALPQWKKERDGSLCSTEGFELVSPVFPFDVSFIKRAIKRFDTKGNFLMNHINADGSGDCGFHVTVSHPDKTATEIFDSLFFALPLLYALYPSRTENTFCSAPVNPDNYTTAPTDFYLPKYRPIHIKSACVEIRIFPFLEDVKQLAWRLRLVRALLDNPVATRADLERHINTGEVNALLRELYGKEYGVKMSRLCGRIYRFATRYNFPVLTDGEPTDGIKHRW